MKVFIFISLVLIGSSIFGQSKCNETIRIDTLSLENPFTIEPVKSIDVTIKNKYLVQFIKHKKKQYLKITVKDDLGFGRTGTLKLILNKKQIYIKEITLQTVDKNSGYFLIELNQNYLLSIVQNGLTSIVFLETIEFSIPRQDSEQIKKAAKCFTENSTKQ